MGGEITRSTECDSNVPFHSHSLDGEGKRAQGGRFVTVPVFRLTLIGSHHYHRVGESRSGLRNS